MNEATERVSHADISERAAKQEAREQHNYRDEQDAAQFAAFALMGMCSRPTIGNAVDIARTAWKVSDEMLAERKRREEAQRGKSK